MGFCARKGVKCECLTDHSVCNTKNCHRKLPDVSVKTKKKIKIFKNHEEYHVNPSGSRYVTGTWARDEAEKFINRSDIKVLDIKYGGGSADAIMIVYEEV